MSTFCVLKHIENEHQFPRQGQMLFQTPLKEIDEIIVYVYTRNP